MNKAYNRINWENYPSDATPLNEQNLNKMDGSLDEVDNRVITLDTTKATKTEVAPLIKEIEFNESNGIFTITRKNGSKFTIDTKLEKIAINFGYDPVTQKISLTLIDGTVQYIDLSALITQYEFMDTDTVSFFVDTNGKVSAIVKDGSITEDKLQPNYLAKIKVEVAKAEAAATAADASKTAAAGSASTASTKSGEAATSATNAANSATAADASKTAAAASATTATNKAGEAATSATNAANSKTAAATSATNAASSASTATTKANAASASATAAASSATNSDTYAKKSQSYAVGGTGTREGEDTDNAEYYYQQTKQIAQGNNGLVPMGTVSFANLPTSGIEPNSMYNISDNFTSDNRFLDGGGIFYGKGSNVYYTVNGKWDVLAASAVTGVKGDSETNYRQGNVNITKGNIGLGNVDNTSDANKPVSTAQQTALNGKVSKAGDTMSGTLGSSKVTNTYLAGNQGQTIINSTAGAGAYTMLDKLNSTNGYFTDGVYQNKRLLQYTAKSTVDVGTNAVTKSATLLDESGNTQFPGTVTANAFSGNATSATNADKIDGYHVVVLSETAYNALATKDANTFYFRYKE